jgi:hypothetical protein
MNTLEKVLMEVSDDVKKAVHKTANGLKKTSKGVAYIASSPITGQLGNRINRRIYENETLAIGAQAISAMTNMVAYPIIAYHLTENPQPAHAVVYAICSMFGMAEGLSRALNKGSPSFIGYVPAKITEYLLDKYDWVRQNTHEETK